MKVKRFIYTLANSILPQDDYYHDLTKKPFRASIAYFLLFILLSYFVFLGLNTVLTRGFRSERNLASSLIQGIERYPVDLVISVRDGRLMTNYSHPYFFWVNDDDKKYLLAVVDETGEPDKIMRYNATFMLTSEALVIKRGQSFTSLPFGKTVLRVDASKAEDAARRISLALGCVQIFVILFALLGMPVLLLATGTVYTFFVAGVSYMIWRWIGPEKELRKITFKKIHQLSLHAITFPIILCYAMVLAGGRMNNMPFTFLLIMFIFTNTAAYECFIDNPARPRRD